MAFEATQPHFVLFPLMAQGHMIPMTDIAKILAQHNAIVSIITTPHNASRFMEALSLTSKSGFQMRLIQVQFPHKEAVGILPDGCENIDMLPSLDMVLSFLNVASNLQQPLEKLLEELTPRPSCIISDMMLPFTSHIASKFKIPRISFLGVSCFCLMCAHNRIAHRNFLQSIASESEYFVFPGMPDKFEITKAHLPGPQNEDWQRFYAQMDAAEFATYGVIINSFDELEPAYVREFKKVRGEKAWCIGPVSLNNKDHLDKAQRGNKASIDELECLKWLDFQRSGTVIYVCLGSLCNLSLKQLIELALALEASNRPFIWVIRGGNLLEELDSWIKLDGFEERTKARGLLIRGWAPQVLILSHTAIGGFVTHCGWNSTLEAISAGVPMVTWPLFADQFYNEILIVQILKVGVKVGLTNPVKWGEEEKRMLVEKEDIKVAIDELMSATNENEEMRKKIKDLAEMAKRAVEEGGSSWLNTTLFIQDIMQQTKKDN